MTKGHTVNLAAATEKQQAFITTLLTERDYDSRINDTIITSPKDASAVIDLLLKAPKKVGMKSVNALSEALSKVPNSKYAIRTSDIIMDFMNEVVKGDILFVEVKTYNGRKYLRRLHGSVGNFTRSKMTNADTLAILDIIAKNPYEHTKLFGQHYACCGKCGAELTDERSRALMLGPECRKSFGF
jgi:hypothetical protein